MRICLVSQEYPPQTAGGGIGTQTYAKAHGLAALGHAVVVLAAGRNGERSVEQTGDVLVVRTAGLNDRISLYTEAARWMTYSTAVAMELEGLHRESAFDLIEFPEWASEGFVPLLNRTEWNSVPMVVQIHGPLAMFQEMAGWPEAGSDLARVGSLMEQICLERADAVYSSSQHSVDWCRRAYGLTREIPVLHTGVDTERFHPSETARSGRPVIVFAGRIDPQKGVDTLFEAACLLRAEFPDLELRLIGRSTSPLSRQLQQRAAQSGVEEMMTMAGYLPNESLPAQFAEADVFASPSIGEGGPGFVYLEAMACGLPAIACRGTGAAEAIVDGVTGLLVERYSVAELAGALRSLLLDAVRRRAMGLAARKHVLATAERRSCIREIDRFYRKVAG